LERSIARAVPEVIGSVLIKCNNRAQNNSNASGENKYDCD
jgi:hypothetical protein